MTKIEGGSPVVAPTVPVTEGESKEQAVVKAESAPSQELDCWGKEEPEKGFFAGLGSRIGERIDEVVDGVVEAGKEKIEEARETVQALTEPLLEALQPDPEIVEEIRSRTEEIAQGVKEVIFPFDDGEIEAAYEKVMSGEVNLLETAVELVANREKIVNYGLVTVVGEGAGKGFGLLQGLAHKAAEVARENEVVLGRVGEELARASKIVGESDDAMGVTRLLFPQVNLIHQVVRAQLELAVKACDPEAIESFAETMDTASNALAQLHDLEPGNAVVLDLGIKIGGAAGAGFEGGATSGLKISKDANDPSVVYLEAVRGEDGKLLLGAEVMGAGKSGAIGTGKTEKVQLRFDLSEASQYRELQNVVFAHVGLIQPDRFAKALPDRIVSVTKEIRLTGSVQGAIPTVAGLSLGGAHTLRETRHHGGDEVIMTRSYEYKVGAGGGNDMILHVPDKVFDDLGTDRHPALEAVRDFYHMTMKNQVGVNLAAEFSFEVGFDHPDGSIDEVRPESISRIFAEHKGKGSFGPNDASVTILTEIHQPAEFARLIGSSFEELNEMLGSEAFDLEHLGTLVAARGRDIAEFVSVKATTQYEGHDRRGIEHSHVRATVGQTQTHQEEFQLFPPNLDLLQEMSSNIVAEANHRLMDRAWRP